MIKKNPIAKVAIVIFLVLAMGLTFIFKAEQKARQQKALEEEFNKAPAVTGFLITEYRDLKKVFCLSAEKVYVKNKKIGIFRVASGKIAEMKNVKMEFYKSDTVVSVLRSKRGILDRIKKDTDFYGHVGLLTEDKRLLTCDSLRWNNKGRYLLAEGNCILRAEGKTARADLIKTDVELRDFNVISKETGDPIKKMAKIFYGRWRK